jgi:pimeloyl-ACP methyl ester carboxylesterase
MPAWERRRSEEMAVTETGYAPVNGLRMYYEIHGSGGTPLLLLHGGLFNIDLQFGGVLPSLAATHKTSSWLGLAAGEQHV